MGLIVKPLLIILVTTFFIIDSGNTANYKYCEWDFKNQNSPNNISKDCTTFNITVTNGSKLNWNLIERLELPNLEEIIVSLTTTKDNFREDEFEWKKLLFFVNETTRGYDVGSSLFLNDQQRVMHFRRWNKRLKIDSIDPYQVFNAFRNQEMHVKVLEITNSTIEDSEELIPPNGIVRMTLDNVRVRNFSGFIQKFNSLATLSLLNNSEEIDISAILSASKNIKWIEFTNNSLTLTDPKHRSESMEGLYIRPGALDSSFNENAWKVMPNVRHLMFSFNPDDNVGLGAIDIVPFRKIETLYLTNVNLTSNKKPTQIWKNLTTLYLNGRIDFDSKVSDFIWDAFPNLKYLTVRDLEGKSKPNKDFLTGVLRNLPDIERISMDQFDLVPLVNSNQAVEMTYYFNPKTSKEGINNLANNDRSYCEGVLNEGKLKIYFDNQQLQLLRNNTLDCKKLKVTSNGTDLDWNALERLISLMPKSEFFRVHSICNELDLYINGEEVFKYMIGFGCHRNTWNTLIITSIYPNYIMKIFKNQGIQIENLTIVNAKIDDKVVVYPDGVSVLKLQNTQIRHMSSFLLKFKSLTHLTLINFGNIDICEDVLETSTNLEILIISHANVTCASCQDTTVKLTSNILNTLDLHDCVLDSNFIENGSNALPNLRNLRVSAIVEKIDFAEFSKYKKLASISITNASLSFENPFTQQFKELTMLDLINCEFDSMFMDHAWNTFLNLIQLTVDSRLGGMRPTQVFLSGILAKIPNIRYIYLNPFDYTHPLETKGEFKITYNFDRIPLIY